MKSVLTIIILFIFINISFSQNDSTIKKRITIYYSPLSILDPSLPSLQFGLDYRIAKRISAEFDYGQKMDIYDFSNFPFKGFRVNIELKYFPTITKKQQMYVSFEYFIKNNFYGRSLSYIPAFDTNDTLNNISYELHDYYKIDKWVSSGNIKFGKIYNLNKKIVVDFFIGMGIKKGHRNISELEFDEKNGDKDVSFYEWAKPEYKLTKINSFRISIGVKIGLKI